MAKHPQQRVVLIRGLKIFFFALVLFGLIYLLRRDFNAADFQGLLYSAQLKPLLWACWAFLTAMTLKAFRLVYLSAGMELPLSLWRCFKIQVVTISFSMLTPGRAGEFYKAFLLSEGAPQKLGQGAVVMFVERLLDVLILALTSLAFAWLVLRRFNVPLIWPSLLVLMGLALTVLGLFVLFRYGPKLLRFLPEHLQRRLRGEALDWSQFIPRVVPAVLMTALIWGVEGMIQWFLFLSLDLHLSLPMIIAMSAIISLSAVLSLLPIGLGTVDLSALFLYGTVLGLSQEAVIFQVTAGRIVGVGGLFLLLLGVLVFDPQLVWGARQKMAVGSDASEKV